VIENIKFRIFLSIFGDLKIFEVGLYLICDEYFHFSKGHRWRDSRSTKIDEYDRYGEQIQWKSNYVSLLRDQKALSLCKM
jgi:hypothetical protein